MPIDLTRRIDPNITNFLDDTVIPLLRYMFPRGTLRILSDRAYEESADYAYNTWATRSRSSELRAGLRRRAGAAGARPDRLTRHARMAPQARWYSRAGLASQRARTTPGSGPGASATRSTSTWTSSRSSTLPSRRARRPTSPGGGPTKRGIASPGRQSSRSSWRSPTSIRSYTEERAPESGVLRSLLPTRAAGGRSTGPAIP